MSENKDYTVEWSTTIEAQSMGHALRIAIEQLSAAIDENVGATIFAVTSPNAKHYIDIEIFGFCDDDECNELYVKHDERDHCAECGTCWEHCNNVDHFLAKFGRR